MINKLHLTILFLILFQFTVLGQTFSKEFGKISQEELESDQYSDYENADAVVLYDIGKSYFELRDNSFEVHFKRTTRIKVLSETGIDWAQVDIPFYNKGSKSERVYDIKAYSYNEENGKIKKTSIKKSNSYDEKINDSWSVKKFAIPNVKKGSIIEYTYKIRSPFILNLKSWEFQWKIPVVYSEYEISMVPFYEYVWLLQGGDKLDSYESYIGDRTREYDDSGNKRQLYEFISDKTHRYDRERVAESFTFNDNVHKFTMKDIAAFESEEYITSIKDHIIKLDFQLSRVNNMDGTKEEIVSTWEDMNKDLLDSDNFGEYVKESESLASKLLDKKSLSSKNEKDKFNHVMNYVKENYSWNKTNDKYTTKSARSFVKDKSGNSAEINLFTIGLLNHIGIEAKPVLISTRGNGRIKYDYPYAHFFNYVVILARVNGVYELTDATEVLNLNNRIPIRGLNDKGLIIQKYNVDWISMRATVPSELKTDIQIEMNDNEIIKSTISKTATEYDALSYRNNYSDKIETIREKLESKEYTIIESSILVENQLNIEEPYILTYEQTSKPEIVNEKIHLSPFLDEVISDNPLKQKERNYPIDMTYPQKRIFNTTIIIPEGFEVDYLPSERTINNQLFELTYAIESDDKEINISFVYHFKTTIYSSDEYSIIKDFFDIIVEKGKDKIVLSKKEEV